MSDSSAHPDLPRRLLTLSGLVPLGVFILSHLVINARILHGQSAFADAVARVQAVPGLALVEWGFVLLPLALHAVVGLWIAVTRPVRARPSPYPPMVQVAVRVTGVLAIGFLALHLPEVRFRSPGLAAPDGGQLATILTYHLSATWHGVPWRGALYLVGAACVAFHFAAGLWAVFASGLTGDGVRARRWAGWAAGAIGAAVWLLFANIVVLYATGSRLFGADATTEPTPVPCPAKDAP